MSKTWLQFLPLWLPTVLCGTEEVAFFESKVRPILEAHCLECHAGSKNKLKGGLDLETAAGWAAGGDSGPVIVPGDAENSPLIKAVRYHDASLEMPPKGKLSAAEIQALERWVEQGAVDPRTGGAAKVSTAMSLEEGRKFWSWRRPQKPALPEGATEENAIDAFLDAKAEAAGQQMAADASATHLVRRLHFVLTGMAPSPEAAAAFSQDYSANPAAAVTKWAERLMATQHHAEEMARRWLDVARFAESSGGGRTLLYKDAWRYRDWVIQAIQHDMPIDQFIREQLAGDLLPAADYTTHNRQLTATAFLCLGPTNYEEQDKQQLRYDIIDEQLDTIGKVMLGQTLGCARCHDHKFDPISQRDYYALAGIFASTHVLENYTDNVARWIDIPLRGDADMEAKYVAHEKAVAELKEAIKAARRQHQGKQNSAKIIAIADLPGIVVDDTQAAAVGDWEHSTHTPGYVGKGYLHDKNEGKGRKTLTFTPKFPQTGRYEVLLAWPAEPGRAPAVPVHIFHADGETTVSVDQSQPPPTGKFLSLGTWRFEKDGAGFVMVSNEGTKTFVCVDAVQFLPAESAASPVAASPPSSETNTLAAMEEQLKKLERTGPQRPVAMSVREASKPEDVHIRIRGQVHQKGELVPRGFLAITGGGGTLPPDQSGRREFAEWITSSDHPLTARVFVNRVWTWLMGAGLVRTVDNFGVTGEKPTHPELLDWLAVSFMEKGWSLDWLVKTIVSTKAWRREAGKNPADPDNLLLTRAFPHRLEAEQLRDALLQASGELDLAFLGPNMVGATAIDANDTGSQNVEYRYEFNDFRRSLYTPAFRNKRLELFEVFDFGNINVPQGKRHASTVAPQTLFLLNDPWITARAEAFARRLLSQESATTEERIRLAWQIALQRTPTPAESQAALDEVGKASPTDEKAQLEIWTRVCQGLFASIDFRYLR